ncbi:MAG TPA: serine/threonine-protein kinase [Thermoanaerobaculia bacterium]|nr:serine/threonine-protein kinase [Thermoanaerobaculia bacterium]
MDPERWRRVSSLLDEALERPEGEREGWLRAACGGDEALFEEIASLLGAYGRAGSFLDQPARAGEGGAGTGADIWAGRRLGNYTLIREIGRGGMSVVYLGERADQAFEQKVAIKLVHPGFADPRLAERIVQERKILARLEHPHIARLLDGGTTDEGVPYFVLELVVGLPIDEHCDRHALSIPERLRLFRTVCDAVAYAHRNLVVHRDLKPSNILVAADGAPKLLDFGIAKVLAPGDATGVSARTVLPALTPRYASPEQLRGEPVTTATDTYSLGVILDQLLTGTPPRSAIERLTSGDAGETVAPSARLRRGAPASGAASGEEAGEVLTLEEIARRRSTSPRGLLRQLEGDLDNVIRKALRPEPERRYASVERLGEDLRRHLEHLPVEARPDSWGYRAGKLLRRNSLAAGLALLLVLLLAGSAVTSTLQARRIERERVKAERALALLVGLFRGADPLSRGSTPPTIDQVLDLGAQRTLAELGREPELEATLASAIGDVYADLGRPEKADPLVARALALRRELFGEESPEYAASLHQQGMLRFLQGKLPEAERSFAASAEIERRLLPADDPRLADTLEGLGRSRYQLGKLDEALASHREGLRIRLRRYGTNHSSIVSSLGFLSTVTDRQGHDAASLHLLELALPIARRHFEPDDPRLCSLQNGLGVGVMGTGRLAESEALLRQALACRRKRFGPEHPEVAFSLDSLGTTLVYEGRLAQAEARFREALAMREKLLGRDHPLTALTLSNLADLHRRLGRVAEAEEENRRALVLVERAFGPDHLNVTRPLFSLAKLELARGHAREALPLLERSLEIRRRTYIPHHWRIAEIENEIGAAWLDLGRREEGEKLIRTSFEDLKRQLYPGEFHLELARDRVAALDARAGK